MFTNLVRLVILVVVSKPALSLLFVLAVLKRVIHDDGQVVTGDFLVL